MFDSPAYANLTTAYLERVFNPRTPNDPRVRYFSVGGVAGRLNVWHPLWFSKLVVDGAEAREREEGEEGEEDSAWGNDGLVTVRSAQWGEYLGTLQGADHWRLRGAGGLELGEQLPELVSAQWNRLARVLGSSSAATGETGSPSAASAAAAAVAREQSVRTSREEERRIADVLAKSTERLSAVVDWLVEHVPMDSRRASIVAFSDVGIPWAKSRMLNGSTRLPSPLGLPTMSELANILYTCKIVVRKNITDFRRRYDVQQSKANKNE